MPLPLAFAPTLAAAAWLPKERHLWLVLVALPTSRLSLGAGWQSRWRFGPLVLDSTGLLFLLTGVIAFGGITTDAPFTMMGSIALGYSSATRRISSGELSK